MDVYILYFTLHGHDPNGLTSWSAIIVDEGDMESFVGSGPSEFEALLDGLTNCLGQIPTTLPIVVRTRHRSVLQLGKRWLDTWRTDGWDNEVQSDNISQLMGIVEPRNIEWFSPNYADQLDKTLVEYAIEEWTYQDEQFEPIEDVSSEAEHLPDAVPENATDAAQSVDTEEDFEQDETKHTHTENVGPIESTEAAEEASFHEHCAIEEPTDDISAESQTSDLEDSEILLNEAISPIQIVDKEDVDPPVRPENGDEQPDQPLQSVEAPSEEPTATFKSIDIPIDPNDQERFPYVDDDGWRQLYTLFDAPFDDIVERPSRIVAYVTACHNHDLASWSFALIDKPSRMAFFKAVGHRHSTYNRALLQGCIALLTTLKSSTHTVELRIMDVKLADLLTQLIENPYAMVEDEHWMMESAFVSQLSYWLELRNLSVRKIDDRSEDTALQMIQWLSTQRLTALNYGEVPEFSIRKPRFPLETLLD